MTRELISRTDVFRHTAARAAIACGLTLLILPCLFVIEFGTNPAALVTVGSAFRSGLLIAAVISSVVAAGLTFRSAILLRDLVVTREQLLRLSRTDQLTGLLNRRGFEELANDALTVNDGVAAVMMCDIDHFKDINDRHGHEFGDEVLVAVARLLQAFAEAESGLVARHGGEEFVLLLTGPNAHAIELRAEVLRIRCATEVSNNGMSAAITVSIGFASAGENANLQKIVRAADEALFAAKRNGRNCVVGAPSPDRLRAA